MSPSCLVTLFLHHGCGKLNGVISREALAIAVRLAAVRRMAVSWGPRFERDRDG
jgi:hypothetical protein